MHRNKENLKAGQFLFVEYENQWCVASKVRGGPDTDIISVLGLGNSKDEALIDALGLVLKKQQEYESQLDEIYNIVGDGGPFLLGESHNSNLYMKQEKESGEWRFVNHSNLHELMLEVLEERSREST